MSHVKPTRPLDLQQPTAPHPSPAAEPTLQPNTGASPHLALDSMDHTPSSVAAAHVAGPVLAAPLAKGPVEALVLEKVFAVLDKLFANPAFLGALTALSAMPRLTHIVAGLTGAVALLMYLQEWLVRGRQDPHALMTALAGFAGTLVAPGALAAGLGLTRAAALLTRKRSATPRRPLTVGFHNDEEIADLLGRASNKQALTAALDDDEALDAFIVDAQALLGEQQKLLKLQNRRDKDTQRLEAIALWATQTLPGNVAWAVGKLAYNTARVEHEGRMHVGALVCLAEPETLASLTSWLTAQDDFAEHSRLDVEAALCAYNGLTKTSQLTQRAWVYLPTADETVPPPTGWPDVMPLRATVREQRQRLVEATSGLLQGRAAHVERLVAFLDKMPVRPLAYDVSNLVPQLQGA